MKRCPAGWSYYALILIGMTSATASGANAPKTAFANWPASWVETYRRFDTFIATRAASFPNAGLEIAEDGSIIHRVRILESRTEHLTLDFFRRGRHFMGMRMADDLMAQGRPSLFVPGIYAACIRASGDVGYQYLYPLIWIEVTDALEPVAQTPEPERPRKIRMIDAPAAGEACWPNERLLHYLDFNIFPKGHPWDIEKANRKVTPATVLRLDNHGLVERDALPDAAAERLLCWRIYRNGRLVNGNPAAGVTRFDTDLGPGTYQVWMGVEGSSGFMPVSNLLEYPLFPSAVADKNVVIPMDRDHDGTPDFFKGLDIEEMPVTATTDLDNDGVPDQEKSPKDQLRPRATASQTVRDLIDLWEGWKFDLSNRPPVPRTDREK